jgi:hypothetical protein
MYLYLYQGGTGAAGTLSLFFVRDGQANVGRPRPASLQEKVPHSIIISDTIAQLILLESRPDHHGIDVSGSLLDNSRMTERKKRLVVDIVPGEIRQQFNPFPPYVYVFDHPYLPQ